jgi:hypothetical protein
MNAVTIAECCAELAKGSLPFRDKKRHGVLRALVAAELVRLAKIANPWGKYWLLLKIDRSNCSRARRDARQVIAANPEATAQAVVITRLARLLLDEEQSYPKAMKRLGKEFAAAAIAVAGNKSAAGRKIGCDRGTVLRMLNRKDMA